MLRWPSQSWIEMPFGADMSEHPPMSPYCSFGFILESLQYNNAFFVRSDIAQGIIPQCAADDAYRVNYKDKSDRSQLFPWNEELEPMLTMTPTEALKYFERRLSTRRGTFELSV